jgi:hypothetical protein
MALEDITPDAVERWRGSLTGLSNRTKNKLLIVMHGVFRRAQTAYGLAVNPLARIEKHPQRSSGDIEVFAPEEVWALVRAAASEQDGALFLTAAFTGLRLGELLALRWRDVDFAGETIPLCRHLFAPSSSGRRRFANVLAAASSCSRTGHALRSDRCHASVTERSRGTAPASPPARVSGTAEAIVRPASSWIVKALARPAPPGAAGLRLYVQVACERSVVAGD